MCVCDCVCTLFACTTNTHAHISISTTACGCCVRACATRACVPHSMRCLLAHTHIYTPHTHTHIRTRARAVGSVCTLAHVSPLNRGNSENKSSAGNCHANRIVVALPGYNACKWIKTGVFSLRKQSAVRHEPRYSRMARIWHWHRYTHTHTRIWVRINERTPHKKNTISLWILCVVYVVGDGGCFVG